MEKMIFNMSAESHHKILDAVARDKALQVDASFIVQAPAGSGKTELLIRRYLTLLSTVETPEEIIAITFTIKAASEMRHRVLRAIEGAQNTPPTSSFELQTWKIASKAWRRSIELNWQLEKNPARLRILTIDALSLSLVRRMPGLSGFASAPKITSDAAPLYRDAARLVLQQLAMEGGAWAQEIGILLRHLDNQVTRAIELLANMLQRRDLWLRHLGSGRVMDPEKHRARLEMAWKMQRCCYPEHILLFHRQACSKTPVRMGVLNSRT